MCANIPIPKVVEEAVANIREALALFYGDEDGTEFPVGASHAFLTMVERCCREFQISFASLASDRVGLERIGFIRASQRGSHLKPKRSGQGSSVIVPVRD